MLGLRDTTGVKRMTTILSVDLASRRSSDIGVVLLERHRGSIRARRADVFGGNARPTAIAVADSLDHCARTEGVQLMILDGPQAWKSPDNGLIFARKCEADLATQGKTGLPGHCTPSTYLRFIQFSISVFDALADRGWPRLASAETGPENLALESFPTAAWRSLGLSPLPGKRSATAEVVRLKQTELELLFSFRVGTPLSHDEVQALVAGFAGLAVATSSRVPTGRVSTAASRRTWREGFIVNPLRGIGAAV